MVPSQDLVDGLLVAAGTLRAHVVEQRAQRRVGETWRQWEEAEGRKK